MQVITTTELRTKSSQLVDTLKKGQAVSLIHRSNIIGVIEPSKIVYAPPVTVEKLRAFLKAVKPKKLIPRSQREQTYRKQLVKKYGKGIL